MRHFDIVHAADPRYLGGTSSALRGEIVGAARWGVNCALLPCLGPRGRVVSGFEPRLAAILAATGIPILPPETPASCDILLAHHPNVFEFMPLSPVALRPSRVVCVLHHPVFDGTGKLQYNLERIWRSLTATYAAPVVFAPISPIVRAQVLTTEIEAHRLLAHNLCNLLDELEWAPRTRPAPRHHAVIGRHARSDRLKWPDTPADILAAYPNGSSYAIRVLGAVDLPDGMLLPANWTTRPFTATNVAGFLESLDFYVYFHSKRWVEAFGIAIAEAMVSGIVTVLPPSFEPVFEDGAVYGHPQDVRGILDHFLTRPDEYARQSRAGRRVVMDRYSVAAYKSRIQQLYADVGLPATRTLINRVSGDMTTAVTPAVPAPVPVRRRILMVAGNGIGLGHVTRLMAIARRLPDWVDPVFLTLSLATGLVREAGFSADYIPAHRKAGVTEASWNHAYTMELLAAIDATGATMVVFDGNDPYAGIMTAMALRKDLAWVWVRRGMWQPHQKLNPVTLHAFDMVIEPGELAADDDGGATARLWGVERVGPILLTNPDDRADRAGAAAKIGADPKRTLVALQLGSRQNFELAPLREAVICALARLECAVIEIENPLAQSVQARPSDPPFRRIYPVYPWSRAIDLLVTTAGYNAYHESVYGGVPTIFVPNEAAEMDDQYLRAAFAQSSGLGLMMTATDAPRAADVIVKGLSANFAWNLRQRSTALTYFDGADAAAKLICGFLISLRTDRPLHTVLPRRF